MWTSYTGHELRSNHQAKGRSSPHNINDLFWPQQQGQQLRRFIDLRRISGRLADDLQDIQWVYYSRFSLYYVSFNVCLLWGFSHVWLLPASPERSNCFLSLCYIIVYGKRNFIKGNFTEVLRLWSGGLSFEASGLLWSFTVSRHCDKCWFWKSNLTRHRFISFKELHDSPFI